MPTEEIQTEATQPSSDVPTDKQQTVDPLDSALATFYDATAKLVERTQTFGEDCLTSRTLKSTIETFIADAGSTLEEIRLIGVEIEDVALGQEEDSCKMMAGYEKELANEIADAIDELPAGPDLSLRMRFEELRKRLAAGEPSFDFNAQEPFGCFRAIAMQIASSHF